MDKLVDFSMQGNQTVRIEILYHGRIHNAGPVDGEDPYWLSWLSRKVSTDEELNLGDTLRQRPVLKL